MDGNVPCFNLFSVFPLFQKGIDAKMKELTQAGIGKLFICIIY